MRATTLLLVGLMACGDDSTAADAGNDSGTDATVAPDTATVDAGVDTATEDAGDTDATDSGADTDDTSVDLLTSLTDGMELLFDTDFDSLTAGALVESEAEDVLFDYRFGAERTTVVDTPHGQGLRFLFEAGQCCYWEGFRALRTLPRVVRGTMVHHFRFRFFFLCLGSIETVAARSARATTSIRKATAFVNPSTAATSRTCGDVQDFGRVNIVAPRKPLRVRMSPVTIRPPKKSSFTPT